MVTQDSMYTLAKLGKLEGIMAKLGKLEGIAKYVNM